MEFGTFGVALKLGNRFYYKHNDKRVLTAWHIDGAKVFMPGDLVALNETKDFILNKRFIEPQVVDVIDERVANWHESNSDLPIHEYLEITSDQYEEWLLNSIKF